MTKTTSEFPVEGKEVGTFFFKTTSTGGQRTVSQYLHKNKLTCFGNVQKLILNLQSQYISGFSTLKQHGGNR